MQRGDWKGGPLAVNTVNDRCKKAKQFLNDAVEREQISKNPFAKLQGTVSANPERFHFVTQDDIAKVLDECPDAEWRLIVALCRYGGLRCPSETMKSRWEHIDWANGRMTVISPKTAHHRGKESRVIPIFPELLPFLQEAWECADVDDEHVIKRYRSEKKNFRTRMRRIIQRAGLEPWPKVFQNMRSTRQTELEDKFPSHVVCAWLGNSETVARKHYLQVTDEHFAKALQNPVQQPAVMAGNESQADSPPREKPPLLQGVAADCEKMQVEQVHPEGLEPPTLGSEDCRHKTVTTKTTKSYGKSQRARCQLWCQARQKRNPIPVSHV